MDFRGSSTSWRVLVLLACLFDKLVLKYWPTTKCDKLWQHLLGTIEKVGYSGRGGKGLIKKVTKNDKDGSGVAKWCQWCHSSKTVFWNIFLQLKFCCILSHECMMILQWTAIKTPSKGYMHDKWRCSKLTFC